VPNVEAAHLIPFSESHDDDPRNGIALAPTLHWALDRYLIAPGPDYKWHVSPVLDSRIRDNTELLEF
jgi:putative restriction endonuclease